MKLSNASVDLSLTLDGSVTTTQSRASRVQGHLTWRSEKIHDLFIFVLFDHLQINKAKCQTSIAYFPNQPALSEGFFLSNQGKM